MTLQSKGPLSLSNIVTEFGGVPPHALSEYYGAAPQLPKKGKLAVSNFYGTSNIIFLAVDTTKQYSNFNIASYLKSVGVLEGCVELTFDAVCISTSTSTPAMITGDLSAYKKVTLALGANAYVIGKGGRGGNGGGPLSSWQGLPGGAGFRADHRISIKGWSKVHGGGGGGSATAEIRMGRNYTKNTYSLSGGGGGAGFGQGGGAGPVVRSHVRENDGVFYTLYSTLCAGIAGTLKKGGNQYYIKKGHENWGKQSDTYHNGHGGGPDMAGGNNTVHGAYTPNTYGGAAGPAFTNKSLITFL